MPKKVIDCRASDHTYLHRDFHGALCYAIRYLDETYGPEATDAYLEQVGRTVYAPLIEAVRTNGLEALQRHWEEIFALEGGDVSIRRDGNTLVIEVNECPAVAHLKARGQFYTARFCRSTEIVNRTVSAAAGLKYTGCHEPGTGRCTQRFQAPERSG